MEDNLTDWLTELLYNILFGWKVWLLDQVTDGHTTSLINWMDI